MLLRKVPVCLLACFMLLSPALLADDVKPAAEATAAVAAPAATPAATPAAAPAEAVTPAPGAEEKPADAIAPVTEDSKLGTLIEKMVKAFNAKDWGIFAGLAIMIVIWGIKKFIWKSLPVGALPWVSAGLGVAVAVATGLFAGLVWWKAILNGLTVGAAASGLWSMVGKRVFGENEPKAGADAEKAPA